jgi:hypothetical protein
LGTIGAILGAAACFNREESAKLHFTSGPMFFVNGARLIDKIEEGELIECE